MKFTKKDLRELCWKLGFNKEITFDIVEGVKNCIDKKRKHIDFKLSQDIYPVLELKTGLTRCQLKDRMTNAINESYVEDNIVKYKEILKYNHKPTLKVLFSLFLIHYEK